MIFESKIELTKEEIAQIIIAHLKAKDKHGLKFYGVCFKVDAGSNERDYYSPAKLDGATITAELEVK